jgi:hypothetical protein
VVTEGEKCPFVRAVATGQIIIFQRILQVGSVSGPMTGWIDGF